MSERGCRMIAVWYDPLHNEFILYNEKENTFEGNLRLHALKFSYDVKGFAPGSPGYGFICLLATKSNYLSTFSGTISLQYIGEL
jgi:hypothetical protein